VQGVERSVESVSERMERERGTRKDAETGKKKKPEADFERGRHEIYEIGLLIRKTSILSRSRGMRRKVERGTKVEMGAKVEIGEREKEERRAKQRKRVKERERGRN